MDNFSVGQSKSISVKVTKDDIFRFSELSGDYAPIHEDEKFALEAGFNGVITHGAFLGALISRLVGMEFPGPNAILEKMDLNFRSPCYPPCQLEVRGTIRQISEAVNTIVLDICIVNDGVTIVTGKTYHRMLNLIPCRT
jgi:3-hydroxybutyryl-CoA dehydratase